MDSGVPAQVCGSAMGPASLPFTVLFGHGGGTLQISGQFSGDGPGALAA